MNAEYPSLAEVRAAHATKRDYERYLFVSRYLFRPLAFLATWVLVRIGLSSEAASWLSGAAALAGFVCLLWPGEPLLWAGVAFLFLFNFFDCLDGGIARIMGTRNPYGRFLDSIMSWADMLFWAIIGVAVWRMPALRLQGDLLGIAPAAWLAAGFLCSFFAAYYTYLEATFDAVLRSHWEKLSSSGGEPPPSSPLTGRTGAAFWGRVLVSNLRVRETHYVLLALACLAGAVDLLLAFFLAFNAAFTAALLIIYCRRGRAVFNSGLGRETAEK